MKQWIALFLCLVVVFSFTACGNGKQTETDSAKQDSKTEEVQDVKNAETAEPLVLTESNTGLIITLPTGLSSGEKGEDENGIVVRGEDYILLISGELRPSSVTNFGSILTYYSVPDAGTITTGEYFVSVDAMDEIGFSAKCMFLGEYIVTIQLSTTGDPNTYRGLFAQIKEDLTNVAATGISQKEAAVDNPEGRTKASIYYWHYANNDVNPYDGSPGWSDPGDTYFDDSYWYDFSWDEYDYYDKFSYYDPGEGYGDYFGDDYDNGYYDDDGQWYESNNAGWSDPGDTDDYWYEDDYYYYDEDTGVDYYYDDGGWYESNDAGWDDWGY